MRFSPDLACEALESRCLLAVPLLSIRASDASAAESTSKPNPGAILIERSGKDLSAPLVVSYSVGGTAGSDDFTPLPGFTTIPVGKRSVLVPVTVADDAFAELSETVVITLLPADTYALDSRPAKQAATVTIADNEPVVSISRRKDASEGKTLPTSGEFTVRRVGNDLTTTLRLEYTIASDSTATSEVDFSPLSGFVDILAGKRDAKILVAPFADLHPERTETLRLILTGADRYRIDLKAATATIKITDVARADPLSLLSWDHAGSRDYSVTQDVTDGRDHQIATGTVTHTIAVTGDHTDWTTLASNVSPPSGSIDPTVASFDRRSDGLYFTSLADDVTEGSNTTSLDFAGLKLCGPTLMGSVSSKSAAAFRMTMGTLTGTATSKLTLGSMETITTAAGSFDTVRLTMALQFKGSGRITVGGESTTLSLSVSETFTFWIVDGEGPVRFVDVTAASISGGGITQRVNGTSTAVWAGR